jgi:peptidoglycan/LPS O-acetylase OafA/YrhL
VDDPERAREALDEVSYRRRQVSTLVHRRALPWWYAAGLSVLLLAQAVVLDLRMLHPERVGPPLQYGISAVVAVVIVGLGILVHRSVGLRPRSWAARAANVRLLTLAGVYLAVTIAVGTVLRALDVPWDQTVGACCGLVVVWILGLRRRRSEMSPG